MRFQQLPPDVDNPSRGADIWVYNSTPGIYYIISSYEHMHYLVELI